MRVGLTQQRSTIILYFWTAMFALPTVIAAFMPTWVAILVGAVIFGSSLMIIKTNRDVNA
jgi:UDP-GlcNAc:undecaprenyl-phosphate GlcNAc-1-phosphate transferase